jgi:hypothetical protein
MSIEEICEKYGIKNYTINDDGSIDVNQKVSLSYYGLTELPLKFGVVTGTFYCSDNKLTSLKGSPKWVGGDFRCDENLLTSLEFAPEYVGDTFICLHNNLTNLKFSPKEVRGGFNCVANELTTLEGCPEEVGGLFYCNYNNITSLEFAPKSFQSIFQCSDNPIASISTKMDKDFIRAFNTFKAIKDGVVNLKRLRYVMEMFDKPIDIEKIEKYYTIK